jgi:hypothetical protein
MDRRTLIKAAAASVGGAWVAPRILESMVSPAAAVTAGPCDFYVFKMTRTGAFACSSASASLAECNATIPNGSNGCTTVTRQTSTLTPVLISTGAPPGCSDSSGFEAVTFTIITPGRFFAGQAQSGPSVAPGACIVPTLSASTGTQTTTLTQNGVPSDGVWWAYLLVA